MKIAVVVGNPKPASRTLRVAESVTDVIEKLLPGEPAERQVIDLADYASRLFEWPEPTLAELNDAVAASDVLVVASPTYKATYTGLLKAFLDRYPSNGLGNSGGGVVAIPVMTGAASDHAMATEVNLRPLLVELGATVPSRGLYLVMTRIAELDQITAEWGEANAATLVPAITGRLSATREASRG